jgi:hypothetical protein
MLIYFLGATRPAVPLTKRITPTTIEAYPLVKYFTSYREEVKTAQDLFNAIQAHAAQGHCLIKGKLNRQLTDEDRREATKTDDPTQFICLDFDRYEAPGLEDTLKAMGLADVSYVLQYSARHGLPDLMGTVSAHVFMLLDAPLQAPLLKNWLMNLNMSLPALKDQLSLSRTMTTLRWPLDITTCQNDKLIYIAPPTFDPALRDPLKQRIRYIKQKQDHIPVASIPEVHIGALKKTEREILNTLRISEGLPPRVARTAWVKDIEVISRPDACVVTGIKETEEYIRLNLNGGDSWAYWHPKDNFELIHDFKTDAWYKTKELAPGYYKDCLNQRQGQMETPTEDGDLILAFRDFKTAQYYNGTWNPKTQALKCERARNELQLDHWMQSQGRVLGNFIPIWDLVFDPHDTSGVIVDVENHRINTYTPTEYMKLEPKAHGIAQFPNITNILLHMLGENGASEHPLLDHWLNWFACIFKRRKKPLTAWILHGIEGTGKGFAFNKIIKPLLDTHAVKASPPPLKPKSIPCRLSRKTKLDFLSQEESK